MAAHGSWVLGPDPEGAWRSVGLPIAVSGASVACATACTNPLDVLKVRLQVMDIGAPGSSAAARARPVGMADAFTSLVRHEGPLALWKGLTPSLIRAVCYGGLRLGLYRPIAVAVESATNTNQPGPSSATAGGEGARGSPGARRGEGNSSMSTKVAAGCASGAFAAMLLNPTELIKTRLMADARSRSGVSASSSASPMGPYQVLRGVVREKGIAGLWRGSAMSMTRSAVLTASQCATYDEVKKATKTYTGMRDGVLLHFTASMLAGLVTTTATNPVDMVKTQLYMDAGGGDGGAGVTEGAGKGGAGGRLRPGLAGAFDALSMIVRKEGVAGLMRGWSANYVRLGPQTVITFVALEKFRAYAGLTAL
jgi:solute carrier family 25 (mitochondrial uncoupling protein), member 8/9